MRLSGKITTIGIIREVEAWLRALFSLFLSYKVLGWLACLLFRVGDGWVLSERSYFSLRGGLNAVVVLAADGAENLAEASEFVGGAHGDDQVSTAEDCVGVGANDEGTVCSANGENERPRFQPELSFAEGLAHFRAIFGGE